MLENQHLSECIIRAAITVHKQLGPGFLESVYEEAMAIEVEFLGIPYDRQKTVPIYHRGRVAGEHRLDFLLEKVFIVELKAVQALENIHFSIVRSSLKAARLQSALLFNFATMPLAIKRVGREESGRELTPSASIPEFLSSKLEV